jgi:hypothetical protein
MGVDVLKEFSFIKDDSLSDDLKKFIIDKVIENSNNQRTRQLEERKWRWSTPLAVALTGLITLGGNFFFDYLRGGAEADRKAIEDTREFEFQIIEKELSDKEKESDRARVLLFLVRAGVIKDLNADALKEMALAGLGDTPPDKIGVPSLAPPVGAGPREACAMMSYVNVTRPKWEAIVI